ncbi:hypothetical protein MZ018_21705 (plasmid) [Shewanella sp. JNE10-2]|uniref:hypothetical protein n=1 Tax=unclassified Shewanella TaxID=196818 RepID=UPI002006CDCC|nr:MULTISPECIES: hypothetical protein [unclassified Shewanella]MCK7632258.1 hypothetical protein [Shewanella sp. JNE9-1]MCK7647415.1 hypothetical protein [Shewanella sp. JNE3-1]MCK7655570.1 hypothetical protein [Shewanella sp. JNE4-1]UPO29453.1 hypothetical protein MZ018_21705 [Shewanella sp. JNE10-2]UPO37616.1 hypothetical protein MZ097_21610 [Shewanella sp. JNE7]
MIKLVGTAIFIAATLSGCASTSPNTAGTSASHFIPSLVKESAMNIGGTTYTYEFPQKQLLSEITFSPVEDEISRLKTKAENNLWPEEKLKSEIDKLVMATGMGYFQVVGYAMTIGMASNGAICAMLVQDNNKVEERCMKGIANTPGSNDMWWNLAVLSTNKLDNTKPFEVRVVNTISNQITKMVFTPKTSA